MYIDEFFPLTIGIGGINDGFLFNCFTFRMDGLTGLTVSTSILWNIKENLIQNIYFYVSEYSTF